MAGSGHMKARPSRPETGDLRENRGRCRGKKGLDVKDLDANRMQEDILAMNIITLGQGNPDWVSSQQMQGPMKSPGP